MTDKKPPPRKRSGLNLNAGRLLRATPEQFATWDKLAAKAKLSFSEWARKRLGEK